MSYQRPNLTYRLFALPLLLSALLFSVGSVEAKKVAGLNIPDSLSIAGETLTLNGAGIRKRFVVKVYVGALYLRTSNQDAAAIINADEPMAIRLQVKSGFLSTSKMKTALKDGFKKATKGNTAPIQSEIDQMMALMTGKISKKDTYLLAYSPDTGTVVSKNDEELGNIAGFAFKQALFGIWLSDAPVQASLKKSMLGK